MNRLNLKSITLVNGKSFTLKVYNLEDDAGLALNPLTQALQLLMRTHLRLIKLDLLNYSNLGARVLILLHLPVMLRLDHRLLA